MARNVFVVDRASIRDEYLKMSGADRALEMLRLQEAFEADTALGDALEDSALLEQGAIETRARISILTSLMSAQPG